jgi:hypothetical protein
VAGAWKFGFSPRWEQRFPDGWKWEVNTLGLTSYADADSGQFPAGTTLADDPVNLTLRTVSAATANLPAPQVTISDHYETLDPMTNAVTWEYTTTSIIDQRTGQHVDGDAAGDYYFLPRNLDRSQTYIVSNSSYHSLPMTFQREESVSGIHTYLFSYYGDLVNTAAYPDVQLEAGQAIVCPGFQLEYWVEPTTGELVKYREWCEGDWVVNQATGERVYALSRWGGESTGDDLIRQSDIVNSTLTTYKWMTMYLPLLLAGIGIVALVLAVVPGLRVKADKVTA